jgi:spoIIIJ-associated protein
MEEKINLIEKTVKNLLEKLQYDNELLVKSDGQSVWVQINVEEPGLLIGKSGYTLADLQHLIRVIVNRKIGEFTYLTVDVNDYKLSQKEEAEKEALEAISEVKQNQQSAALSPMNAFQRKVAHIAIKEAGLISQSVGQEPSRRVVIKYRESD